jgi:hypothetical protein
MPKIRKAIAKRIPSPVEALDGPTEAQLANGNYKREDFIHADNAQRVTAYINRGGEKNGRAFKSWHLDRLHKAGAFDDLHYAAGVWYRHMHERGRYDAPKMSNLESVGGSFGAGVNISDATQFARDQWRKARAAIPLDMLGFMDAFLLHNRWPKMHHRERFRTIHKIRDALERIYNAART